MDWERHPERPIFLSTGPMRPGTPDWGMVYALSDIVDVGDRATTFAGDAIDHEVNWDRQADLSPWRGQSIRLEFRILKGSLYSFWFA